MCDYRVEHCYGSTCRGFGFLCVSLDLSDSFGLGCVVEIAIGMILVILAVSIAEVIRK